MKYALILEKNADCCNHTSKVISSLGYLTTPVFSAKKALHAAHMIQFDLIVTWTEINPDDRRSLIGELRRCSPGSVILLLADPQDVQGESHDSAESCIVVHRPLTVHALQSAIDPDCEDRQWKPMHGMTEHERRKRAIE